MIQQLPKYFRIGVYGFLTQHNCLLIAQELIQNKSVLKLPGGGLQLGEGVADALHREFYEELNIEIKINKHIYTSDFFVQSAFHKDFQVIGIYYYVESKTLLPNTDFTSENIQFKWIPFSELKENIFTFETDKKALNIFLKTINSTL